MDTTKPQVRAGCYCRISSDPHDKREGTQRQREDTAALCEVKGWAIVDFYVDDDRSASNGKKRPEWERLLADIRAGKIDAVAAFDQDRINRTLDDFMHYKNLFVTRGIKLATSNNGDIDLSTPAGELMATIKTAVSTHEVAMLRIRTKRAARQKAEKGIPKWRNAFGYLPDIHEPDPVTAPLVKRAYRSILTGASLNDICRTLNSAEAYGLNGQPWTPSTLSLFLRSPRNAGLRAHTHVEEGKTVTDIVGKGNWPALVNEKTWRSAQAKMNAPSRKPGKKTVQKHLLTRVLLCGNPSSKQTGEPCGGYLSGYKTSKGANAYSCKQCRGIAIRAADVEYLLYGLVGDRLAAPDAQDLLKAKRDVVDAEAIQTQIAALYEDRRQVGIERGKRQLDGEQARIATDIINEEISELERQQNDADRMMVLGDIPLGTPQARGAVRRLSADRFRAVLAVLATVTVLPVGKGSHIFDPERVVVDWKE
jgi:DNA invertase Pin-like site-specific DNA recombinase